MLTVVYRRAQKFQTCVNKDYESKIESNVENTIPECFKIASGSNTEVTAKAQSKGKSAKFKKGKQTIRNSEASRQTNAKYRLHPTNIRKAAKHRTNQSRIHSAADPLQT